MVYISNSPEQTIQIAKKLAKSLKGGEIILLNGDLGAGKTTFAKGIALGLDIFDTVTSPTFTIMNSYSGRLDLYHYDMYRIDNPEELLELGVEDNLYLGGVSVIEWNKFNVSLLKTIIVDIDYIDADTRKISIE